VCNLVCKVNLCPQTLGFARSADGYNQPIVFKLVWIDVNEFRTWMCLICGWIYDEATGLPDEGIAPGTRWEDVPMNWVCPECGARKEDFEMVQV
jgi:rubredoxin